MENKNQRKTESRIRLFHSLIYFKTKHSIIVNGCHSPLTRHLIAGASRVIGRNCAKC